jgi:poly-gamma-glutamate synthesis protein (capsule biosynthesis protein)
MEFRRPLHRESNFVKAFFPGRAAGGALLAVMVLILAGCGRDAAAPLEPFPPFYPEAQLFEKAIRLTKSPPLPYRITGLTVPHHLLAADLIAEAFAMAAGQDYRRIIILSPDHFSRSPTPFAVSIRNFQTVMGEVAIDIDAVARVRENPLVSASNLFSHEHGVRALLPFVAHYFPHARVVAVAIHRDSQPPQWDSLAQTLAPLLTPGTLLLQSTDFSHYLPWAQARRYDRETLRVLSAGDASGVAGLSQPQHLDSRGAQYLQLRLQKKVHQAGCVVVASRNSQEYTAQPLNSTTSYLVQVYSPENFFIRGVRRFWFAGDTFFGRYLADKLDRRSWREGLVNRVRQLTGGAPLIVNLEGVMMGACPENPGPLTLCMAARPSLDMLKELNVVAVSLANNHSHDCGDLAFRTMERLLTSAGITVLANRSVTDLGPFRLAALTDLDNRPEPARALLRDADLDLFTPIKPDKPRFVFMHWGEEFRATPGLREQALAARLKARGVELIIGSHPHRAGALTGDRTQCLAYSLGNFIFDQRRPEVSGALLEVIFFPQGTYFLRLHPLGNLYGEIFSVKPGAGLTDHLTKGRRYGLGRESATCLNSVMLHTLYGNYFARLSQELF